MTDFKNIQFKPEDIKDINELATMLQSNLYTEFSKRKAVMYAVSIMLSNAKRNIAPFNK